MLGAFTTKAVSYLRAGTLHLSRSHLTLQCLLSSAPGMSFHCRVPDTDSAGAGGLRRCTLFTPLPRPVGEASPGQQELPPRPSHGTRASGYCWTSAYSTERWSSKAKQRPRGASHDCKSASPAPVGPDVAEPPNTAQTAPGTSWPKGKDKFWNVRPPVYGDSNC